MSVVLFEKYVCILCSFSIFTVVSFDISKILALQYILTNAMGFVTLICMRIYDFYGTCAKYHFIVRVWNDVTFNNFPVTDLILRSVCIFYRGITLYSHKARCYPKICLHIELCVYNSTWFALISNWRETNIKSHWLN